MLNSTTHSFKIYVLTSYCEANTGSGDTAVGKSLEDLLKETDNNKQINIYCSISPMKKIQLGIMSVGSDEIFDRVVGSERRGKRGRTRWVSTKRAPRLMAQVQS